MATKSARIIVQTRHANDGTNVAELSTQSIGYGLHLAWIFATLFGTARVFGTPMGELGMFSSPVFQYSGIAYSIALLVMGLFDQKLLGPLTRKRSTIIAAAIMSTGTLLILGCGSETALQVALSAVAGIATGAGSAILIVFWGTAYSRTTPLSMALNTAISLVIALLVYALVLYVLPVPLSAIAAAALPWIETALLWQHTPRSYNERHELPIFNPLPLRKGPFYTFIALPLFLLGAILGYFREMIAVFMLPSFGAAEQTPLLLSAGIAALIVIIAGFIVMDDERPDSMGRILTPFVAMALALSPSAVSEPSMETYALLFTGYLCLEAMVWILLGSYAQRYRISPILIFGIGRGTLAAGMIAALLLGPAISRHIEVMSYGGSNVALWMMVILIIAIALIPHRYDVERIRRFASTSEATSSRETYDDDIEPTEAATQETHEMRDAGEMGSAPAHTVSGGDTGYSQDGAARDGAEDRSRLEGEQSRQPGNGQEGPTVPAGSLAAPDSGLAGASSLEADQPPAPTALAAGSGVKPSALIVTNGVSPETPGTDPYQHLRRKCERVANRYLLSTRESEVLFFLARGYNAAYLQERLFISEGTAKTHIRHIYRKCNVHNQQELMRMIEDEPLD